MSIHEIVKKLVDAAKDALREAREDGDTTGMQRMLVRNDEDADKFARMLYKVIVSVYKSPPEYLQKSGLMIIHLKRKDIMSSKGTFRFGVNWVPYSEQLVKQLDRDMIPGTTFLLRLEFHGKDGEEIGDVTMDLPVDHRVVVPPAMWHECMNEDVVTISCGEHVVIPGKDMSVAMGNPRVCHWCVKTFDHKLRVCGRCMLTYYCSVECQKAHWKTHKNYCLSSSV